MKQSDMLNVKKVIHFIILLSLLAIAIITFIPPLP